MQSSPRRRIPARSAVAKARAAWWWWLLVLAAAVPLATPGTVRGQERAERAAARPDRPDRAADRPERAADRPERTDRADLERTQIIGNRELPKVLYIVPWKKPLHGNMGGRAVTGVVEEALAPIDRDVLRRQVSYDQQIRAAVTGPAPVAPAAAKAP
jgi:hypothetical protein